ncbi:hypothetical protein VTO73DRAFT_8222 [Trametes versicolor]
MPSSDDASSTSSMKSPRSSTSTWATQSTADTSPETDPAPLPHWHGPLPPVPQVQAPPHPPPQAHPPPPQAHAPLPVAQAPLPRDQGRAVPTGGPVGTAGTPAAGGSGGGFGNWGVEAGIPMAGHQSGSRGHVQESASPTPSSPPLSGGLLSSFTNVNIYQRGDQTSTRQSSGVQSPTTAARQSLMFGGAYPTNPDGSRRASNALPHPSERQYDVGMRPKSAGDVTPKPRRQG